MVDKGIETGVTMEHVLRMTGKQHTFIFNHLFSGDGKEAVAILLCGRAKRKKVTIFCVHKIVLIPYSECSNRDESSVRWSTRTLATYMEEIVRKDFAVVIIHNHPESCTGFSEIDDRSDDLFYRSVGGWSETDLHASLIMMPSGRIFGRTTRSNGEFSALNKVTIAGDEIRIWHDKELHLKLGEENKRNLQTFGDGTIKKLQSLSAAVVGCSGTGSIVIQQLARLGIGHLVLIDPDRVEKKNLNRIVGATAEDARKNSLKVDVMKRVVAQMGMGTEVDTMAENLFLSEGAVRMVAGSDILFGCMDGVIGRHILNKIATFYSLPYFDIGVRLDANGKGGIEKICGTVHYVQPDGADLMDRRVYSQSDLEAAFLYMKSPKMYRERVKQGEQYIKNTAGAPVERPAVISVNMQLAAVAVNELLARIHPYRSEANSKFAMHRMDLTEVYEFGETEPSANASTTRNVGRGDITPLLEITP